MESSTRPARQAGMRLRVGLSLAAALSLVLLSGPAAYANDISGTYRQEGFWQPATQANGFSLGVASTHCNADELTAYSSIQSSTQNAGGTFGSRWPSGIRMSRVNCTGSVGASVDIRLVYLPDAAWHDPLGANHTSEAGGEEHPMPASSAFCSQRGVQYPCGLHPSRVEINDPKYHSSGYNRSRELMHETGHSQGLAHHCADHSIMNDGSTCHVDHWSSVMGYLATDRAGVVAVYPGWRYS